jgi:hypothetical protein
MAIMTVQYSKPPAAHANRCPREPKPRLTQMPKRETKLNDNPMDTTPPASLSSRFGKSHATKPMAGTRKA